MNQYMQAHWPMYEGTHAMRTQLLDSLTDADLAFSPGGKNMTLGQLCVEMGETEYSYLQSLKTLTQDWAYRNTEPGLENSIARLKTWYQTLDDDMKATLEAKSDEDMTQMVERGFQVPINTQLEIYLQALLIFFGKVTIFIRAMNRDLPEPIHQWIG